MKLNLEEEQIINKHTNKNNKKQNTWTDSEHIQVWNFIFERARPFEISQKGIPLETFDFWAPSCRPGCLCLKCFFCIHTCRIFLWFCIHLYDISYNIEYPPFTGIISKKYFKLCTQVKITITHNCEIYTIPKLQIIVIFLWTRNSLLIGRVPQSDNSKLQLRQGVIWKISP